MNERDIKLYRFQAVEKQLNYFLEHRQVDESRIFVYDVFDKLKMLPTDLAYKNSVKKDAIELLKKEYSEKKALDRDDFRQIKSALQGLEIGKGNEIVTKCKALALEDFLRKEIKSEEDIERLLGLIN